ncbi:lipase secretion chaperone [Polyangium mundeleinium]|uniref:Lipase helper protein n=1 Tax=Polyangium mundeleinium TaxID=2995306 RepID=A0ABT5F1P0_9BACT|nr:lipase secretion chaperone [Polyangium mundeleinium]MDC0747994.1 lipase secretion chaperone [Polyangium mundeleinium]
MNRRRIATGFALVTLVAAAGIGAWKRGGDEPARAAETTAETRGGDPKSATRKTSAPPVRRAEANVDTREKSPFKEKARSLRGTDEDGALRVGPDGSLLLGPEILRLFDYYFTTEGEESDETIRARILAAIRERASGPAALQAAALLDQYLAYRKDKDGLALPKDEEADPTARLEALKKLRRKHFGEETADALFGDEEHEGEVAAEASRIRQDETLTADEREQRVAELEASLPKGAREAREAATLPLRARAEADAMRAEGATDEDVYTKRVETLGVEAADRLTELDAQRAAWKARIEAFRKERDTLAAKTQDEAAFKAAEQALLDRSFTPLEQRRVRATLAMSSK